MTQIQATMLPLRYDELPKAAELKRLVLGRLRDRGYLLLRGECSPFRFREISDVLTRDYMPYVGGSNHGRELVDAAGQIVTAPGGEHNGAIPLHGEMSYQRSRPDILFFYCETPAREGGETIYADGIRLYQSLSEQPELVTLLGSPVCYHRKRTPDVWQRLYATRNKRRVLDYCESEGVRARFDGNDVLFTAYIDSLVHPARWDDSRVFINNLLGFALSARGSGEVYSWITYADGTAIPSASLSRVEEILVAHTYEFKMETHDTLILDNRRILHGRRSFTDHNRRILLRMGLL